MSWDLVILVGLYYYILYVLDSERSEDILVLQWCLFNYFFYPVNKMFTRKSASILTYSTLSFRKFNQDGTLNRSFFDFLNSYLMPVEKPPTNYKNQLKTGF